MATLSQSIKLNDGFTPVLSKMQQAISMTVQGFEKMQNATGQSMNIQEFEHARETINQVGAEIKEAENQQERFNNQVKNTNTSTNKLLNTLKGVVSVYAGYQAGEEFISASDQYSNTQAKLNLINDGLQTNEELNNKIFASAERARGSYTDMADIVGKLGITASSAFSSNDEMIQFSELMTKSFKIAGASAEEQSSAMYQLTQAMASGRLQGDEYRSILENAPTLAQAIADEMDVTLGELKELSSEGLITSDIIKSALFNASEEINEQFESIPTKFSDVVTSIKNDLSYRLQPAFQEFSEFMNSADGEEFFDKLANGIISAVNVAANLFNIIFKIGNFFSKNWSIIGPVIYGIVGAMVAYNAVILINNTVMGISKGLTLSGAAIKAAFTGTTLANTSAIAAETAAQWGLNAALLACPITWIILAIIALIAIFYAVIGVINRVAGTSISATGLIAGAFAVLGAFIWNTVVGVINAIIQFLWTNFVEPWIGIIEWVLNVANGGFDSFGDAVSSLIGNIISWFLSLGKVVTKIIDAVFGTDWTAGLTSLQDDVLSWGKNENAITLDRTAPTIDSRIEYDGAWNAGKEWGSNLGDKFSMGDMSEYSLDDFGTEDNPLHTEVDAVNDTVDISSEDLKTMRELAEMKSVKNFVTLTPTVKVDKVDVNNGEDFDSFMAKVVDTLETETNASTKEVYGAV